MRRRRDRRARLAGVAAASLAVLLVSCTDGGGPAGPASSSPAATSTTGQAAGPLTLAVYGERETVRAFREIARAFTEETGTKVDLTAHGDRQEALEKLRGALDKGDPSPSGPSPSSPAPAGGAGTPDVFLLDSANLPDLLPSGRLYPVDEALEERGLQFGDGYQRLALTAFSAGDRLQCMPLEISPRVLYINTELVRPKDLETRGVPLPDEGRWTFEDFAAAARVIARENEDDPDFRAVHLPADVRVLTAFIRSAGGEVVDDVDEPSTLTLDSDEAREAISAYAQLARLERVALTTDDESEALQQFAEGDLAMRFGTRADVPALRESGVPFDVRPLPSFGSPRTVADISGLCIDERSPRLESALDFVAFAAQDEGSAILARSGGVLPANLDVAFGPVFAQQGQRPRSVDVFLGSLRRSGLMPFSPAWRDVAGRVEAFTERLVERTGPLERTLDRRLPQLEDQSVEWFDAAPEDDSDRGS